MKQNIKLLSSLSLRLKLLKLASVFLLLFTLTSLFFSPRNAKAETVYSNGSLSLTTELLVDGKADNLIRILKTSAKAVELKVVLTVGVSGNAQSNAQIVVGGSNPDKIDDGTLIWAQRPLLGIGQALISSSKGECSSNRSLDLPFIGNSKSYLGCNFASGSYGGIEGTASESKLVPVSQKLTYTFNLTPATLQSLRAGPSTGSSTPYFYSAPWIKFQSAGGGVQTWAVSDAGKQIWVQYFDTQDQLDDAVAKNLRPGDVDIYGDNSSNASMGAQGSALLGFINQLINVIVGLIQQFVYFVFYLFIAPVIQAMLSISTYTDTFAAVIYPGWEVVRNVCNILFIVALIAIGLGTLFRIDSYQYKHLLVDLIIAALLVNFSLVISQAILGVADTVQSQFLPNNVEVIRALARDLMAGWKTLNFSNLSNSGFFSNTVQPLFSLALTLGSFVVFSAIAIFLFVRIVMLWVLLMLSPLAYAMRVLPTTKSYAGKWWGEFLKYAFFTPILAFFLNMAAVINNTYNATLNSSSSVFQQVVQNPELLGNSNIATFVFRVGGNLIILVFLIVAIRVAEQAGVLGGDVVAKVAKNGMYLPFKAVGAGAQRGAGYMGRKWNEKTVQWFMETHEGHPEPGTFKKAMFAITNPGSFFKGWKERSEELDHIAHSGAESRGREVAEQLLTWGKLRIPYGQFTERADEVKLSREMENMKKESLMDLAVAAEGLTGAEGMLRRRAIVRAALKNGFMDDLLSMAHFANKYADDDGTYNSAETVNRFLYGYMGHDDQAMRFMAEDLEEFGKDTGHWEYLGHAYYDPSTRTWKRGFEKVGDEKTRRGQNIEKLKNTWQKNYAYSEARKVGGQDRARMAPHVLQVLRAKTDAQGNILTKNGRVVEETFFGRANGELDEFQKTMFSLMNRDTMTQFARYGQIRHVSWQLVDDANVNALTGEITLNLDNVERAEDIESRWKANPIFMKALYSKVTGIPEADVKGLKLNVIDSSGKRTIKQLGDWELTTSPALKELYPDLMKKSGLGESEKKILTEDKLNPIVVDILKGNLTKSQTQAAITRLGVTDAAKVATITNELYKELSGQFEERFNPDLFVSALERKHGLTPEEANKLSDSITTEAKSIFEDASARDVEFNEAAIEPRIRSLITRLKTSPDSGNLSKLTTDDENLIIHHVIQ